MSLYLIRLLDKAWMEPLLPVVSGAAVIRREEGAVGDKTKVASAKADKMPPSAEDYVWTYTETGDYGLRPVVVTVAAAQR
jgi:hypothetical protein